MTVLLLFGPCLSKSKYERFFTIIPLIKIFNEIKGILKMNIEGSDWLFYFNEADSASFNAR